MAPARHATPLIYHSMFIFVAVSLLLPMVNEGAAKIYDNSRNFQNEEKRLTREYHLRQGALRGLIVKPGRQYDLQHVEVFLGIPYAAAPVGSLRFMPPVNAPPWSGVKMATRFAPVCPQSLPVIKKGDPPSLGRQNYMNRLKLFLKEESEDCLYLNIYVPYREQKSKKFPVLVFIHGDSFEWSSGNPYDGRILAAYGNIMVITVNFRLGILGFVKPSLTEHEYGNNGLLDQLAALKWIKDNIEDLNGDPESVTLMGHGTGAACVNFLMLSPISNALFHRAILMSGSALSDWAMTKDPAQYTLQVAQGLGCNPNSKNMMTCLQNKPLSEIKKVQILAREFETPLGPTVAGYFVPNEPEKTMESFPNLLSKYQLLSGVTELESYHDFGVIELDQGILENQRDEFIRKFIKIKFEGAEVDALRDILRQYSTSKLDPQRWNVDTNRDVILNLFSDARTLAPMISFANYQSKANRQSYFYVFGHNSISTDYAPLNKSVHGEELPYVLGIPLGGANSHFHTEYTPQEKLLSEVVMRLWTNFVKNGSPNTQSVNEYYTLDKKQWTQYNVEWPEYTEAQQPFLKLDIPPSISSSYRKNFTSFWLDSLPNKMKRYIIDPLFEYTPKPTTLKPKLTHRITDPIRKIWSPQVINPTYYHSPSYGKVRPFSQPERRTDTDMIYREIQSIKTPSRPVPPRLMEKVSYGIYSTTKKPVTANTMAVKTSSATITLIVSLGVLFLAINFGICAVLYFKKRRARLQDRGFEPTQHSRAEIGEVDVIGQKSSKEDKSAYQTLKNGCSVIKTIGLNKIRGSTNSKKVKKKEVCKTPKSDDSGGFRERFQLRRHLSTSTLDANTKVRDWITNEVMHRCSPSILRKSNLDLSSDKQLSTKKAFTRSEEILSEVKRNNNDLNLNDNVTPKKLQAKNYQDNKAKTSEKTTSTSALGSHSSMGSNKQSLISKHTTKSNDSLKSKGTESIKSKKVSVAIDATPSARTNSILKQKPIELSKSFENTNSVHSNKENKLQRSKTEGDFNSETIEIKPTMQESEHKLFTNVVTLSLQQKRPLKISHKHSSSDPVTDVNYDLLMKEKMNSGLCLPNILPPVTFRNNVNVTSKDELAHKEPLSAEEALMTIKRRNFPKVLPDFPNAQKRLSLQATTLQTFRSYPGNMENSFEKSRVPPQPPPRTTTLERRIAYKNSKPFSSFGIANQVNSETVSGKNYENIDSFSSNCDYHGKYNKSLESCSGIYENTEKRREYPKVIIASIDMPTTSDSNIVIQSSPSQVDISSNVPRVKLPDDFHSRSTGSVTSFPSICSDYNDEEYEGTDDDFLDDIAEDKLIQELVGGVESPTNTVILDSKGPETIFEKRLEIVPVKLNTVQVTPKLKDDYICTSDLFLPGICDNERTAQIKPNFGLNKLQQRSESINKPPEKTVKVKQKKTIKPSVILNKGTKSYRIDIAKNNATSKLEHSNSGSSNDTETSTGTVKKIEIKH